MSNTDFHVGYCPSCDLRGRIEILEEIGKDSFLFICEECGFYWTNVHDIHHWDKAIDPWVKLSEILSHEPRVQSPSPERIKEAGLWSYVIDPGWY